jgi:hypothetical protein
MARFVEFGNQCVNPDHVVTLGVVKDASGETFTKISLINGESISVAVDLKQTMRMLDTRKEEYWQVLSRRGWSPGMLTDAISAPARKSNAAIDS